MKASPDVQRVRAYTVGFAAVLLVTALRWFWPVRPHQLPRPRSSAAERALERRLETGAPGLDARAWLALARSHAARRDWEGARQTLLQALDRFPDDRRLLRALALASSRLGLRDEVRRLHQRLRRTPRRPAAPAATTPP